MYWPKKEKHQPIKQCLNMLCALASRLLCRAENTDCLFPNHIFLKCVSNRNHLFLAKWILGKDERGKNKGRNSISIRHLSTALSHSVKIDFTRDDHWTMPKGYSVFPDGVWFSEIYLLTYLSVEISKSHLICFGQVAPEQRGSSISVRHLSAPPPPCQIWLLLLRRSWKEDQSSQMKSSNRNFLLSLTEHENIPEKIIDERNLKNSSD